MEQINQYIVVKELRSFNEQIKCWHCQKKEDETNYELLTIPMNDVFEPIFNRRLLGELKLLVGKKISGIQTIREFGISTKHDCRFVAYEYDEDYRSLHERRQEASVQSIIDIATGLSLLKKKNLENYAISPKSIRINSKGKGVLCFLGLFELFSKQDLLGKHYLSPNAMKWVKKRGENLVRPCTQDDIYGLIKSFEFILKDLKKYTAATQLLSIGLSKNPKQGFKHYNDFIALLGRLPVRTIGEEDKKAFKVVVNRKRIDANTLRLLLKDMNSGLWVDMADKRSDRGTLEGYFSTTTWNGKFIINPDKSLFIPHCNQEPNSRILNSRTAFKLEASFGEYSSNYNCLPFFEEKFETKKKLIALYKEQHRLVQDWKLLPKQEQEQIETAALKLTYYKREKNERGNIAFYISETTNLSSEVIEKVKREQRHLMVNRQRIGRLLDYQPSKQLVVLTDTKCAIAEIPQEGILVENIQLEISQFRKQVDACEQFEAGTITNPILSSILASPKTAALPINIPLEDEDYVQFKETIFNEKLGNDQRQLEAVLESLNRKPLYLIQGPPGTGKTTVIVELIQQILNKEKQAKILITSQSNLAVDNVLERIHQVNKTTDKEWSFMRLASRYSLDKKTISSEILPHTFEHKLEEWVKQTKQKSKQYFIDQLNEKRKETELKEIQQSWCSLLDEVSSNQITDEQEVLLNNGSIEMDFLAAMMQEINIVGATCIHIASGKYQAIDFQFDYVIMDESSKATPAETLVPINMGRNIILIGDHKQLPPVITRNKNVRKGIDEERIDNGLDFNKTFGKSLFEILIESFEKDKKQQQYIKMLDIQYRMPRQIGDLISRFFYDGKLKNVDFGQEDEKAHGLPLKKDTSIIFISTSKQENPSDNGDKLYRNNPCNVKVIQELLGQLNDLYSDNLKRKKPLTVGVIAGYRGQVNLLRKELDLSMYPSFVQNNKEGSTPLITIDTVDKFQGLERDIIIYDVVRSSPNDRDVIGFLDDYRRMNVAFSRVKRLLIVVGDSAYLRHRAILHPNSDFQAFKLQEITEELSEKGLICNNLSEMLR